MQPCPVDLQGVKQTVFCKPNTISPVPKGKHVKPIDLNELRTITTQCTVNFTWTCNFNHLKMRRMFWEISYDTMSNISFTQWLIPCFTQNGTLSLNGSSAYQPKKSQQSYTSLADSNGMNNRLIQISHCKSKWLILIRCEVKWDEYQLVDNRISNCGTPSL